MVAHSGIMVLAPVATTHAPPPSIRVDGRRARADRTREAIADALLALVGEGDLRPTAGRIAERAEISERLIYHHFADLDALLRTVAERQLTRARNRLAPLDAGAARPERIASITAQRAQLYEWISPIRRASTLQEPFSAELRAARADSDAELREQVARHFAAELDAHARATRRELLAALDVTLSWTTWDRLRTTNTLSTAAARRTVARMLAAQLDDQVD